MRKVLCFIFLGMAIATFAQQEEPAFNFVLRLMDSLAVLSDKEGRDLLSRERITLRQNGRQVMAPSILKSQIHDVTNYTIQRDGNEYQVEIVSDKAGRVNMIFPANRELIEGTDKPTADSLLSERIKQFSNSQPIERMYVPEAMDNGLYIHRGNWFLTPQLRNDIYLSQRNGVLAPVQDTTYLEESMTNLLMGVTQNRVRLAVHHHQYANRMVFYEIALNSLLRVLSDQTELFVACENAKGRRMGYAFFHSESLSYLHVLSVEMQDECITDEVTLTAHLYTYIPQQNLKNYQFKNK